MTLIKRESTPDGLERLLGHWPDWLHRPWVMWPEDVEGMLRVNEYREDGNLVVRAEIAGIDPDKDVEITVANGVLHIEARREIEERHEGKDYVRRELRYGSFSRDLPLPEGCAEEDVTASYKDGILEVRVPAPRGEGAQAPKKVPVIHS